jgi:diguanylate cyclase (GGDEF)-like protein
VAGVGNARERLGEVLEASPDGLIVFRVASDGPGEPVAASVEYLNAAARDWWRLDHPDGHGGGPVTVLSAGQDEVLCRLLASVALNGQRQRLRVHQSPDLGAHVVDMTMTRLGKDLVIAACRDVTNLSEDEWLLAAAYDETAEAQATLRAALDATTDGFAVYDIERLANGRMGRLQVVLMNAAGAAGFRADGPEDLAGKDLRDFYPAASPNGLWDAIAQAVDDQVTTKFRVQGTSKSGEWTGAWDSTIAPVGRDRVVITWRDVTPDARRERDLARSNDAALFAATHDPLTGLANRALLQEKGSEALRLMTADERVAVVYIDLDRFKQINDTLGHGVGDCVLRAVATRLSNLVRSGDTAARLGGDEFVLLLRRLPPDWNSASFIERARASLEQTVAFTTGEICPQASFGVVRPSAVEVSVEQILQEADRSMYQDKKLRRSGRNAVAH